MHAATQGRSSEARPAPLQAPCRMLLGRPQPGAGRSATPLVAACRWRSILRPGPPHPTPPHPGHPPSQCQAWASPWPPWTSSPSWTWPSTAPTRCGGARRRRTAGAAPLCRLPQEGPYCGGKLLRGSAPVATVPPGCCCRHSLPRAAPPAWHGTHVRRPAVRAVQVDPNLDVVKGRGGALLREKASARCRPSIMPATRGAARTAARCKLLRRCLLVPTAERPTRRVPPPHRADGGDGVCQVCVHRGRLQAG